MNEPRQVPCVKVGFDAQTQTVQLQFDPQDFKTWDFVIATLHMAIAEAETRKRLSQAQQLQAMQQQAAQEQLLRRTIKHG